MIVDQPHGLHEGIAGGGADKAEAAPAQIAREAVRGLGMSNAPQVFPAQIGRAVFGRRFVAPKIGGERAEFALHLQRAGGIIDGGGDLAAMANDAGIAQQALDIGLAHGGDGGNVEAVEHRAETLALAQYGDPAQARLEAFKADLLEQPRIADDRPAPFMVVIMAVKRVVSGPGAARQGSGMGMFGHGSPCCFQKLSWPYLAQAWRPKLSAENLERQTIRLNRIERSICSLLHLIHPKITSHFSGPML